MDKYLSDLYTQYISGSVPQDAYFIMNAGWIADNFFKYPPKYHPPIDGTTKAYLESRHAGRCDYDAKLARRLGDWFNSVTSAFYETRSNLSQLLWAKEKLVDVAIGGAHEKLDKQIKQFERVNFDFENYAKAVVVKGYDQRDRKQ
jgi:hypothetical protein